MISAYFPFTYVTEKVARTINDIMGIFFLYQPICDYVFPHLFKLHNENIIDIQFPIIDFDYEVISMFKECHNWVTDSIKSEKLDINLFKIIYERFFHHFYNSPESIRDKIKGVFNPCFKKKYDNILIESCLSLLLAQYKDLQNVQFYLECKNLNIKENLLGVMLKDDFSIINKVEKNYKNISNNEFEKRMYLKRIRAWATVVLYGKVVPDFLVTTSYKVISILLNEHPNFMSFEIRIPFVDCNNKLYCLEFGKMLNYFLVQKKLFKINIPHFKKIDNFSNKLRKKILKIHVLPGISLRLFLLAISSGKSMLEVSDNEYSKFNNTVILYIT